MAAGGEARGGEPPRPEAKEKVGREAEETALSARDLSCSDQLKPWSERAEGEHGLEHVRDWFAVLAWGDVLHQVWLPRLAGRSGGVVGLPVTVLLRRIGGACLPLAPGLTGPRAPRMAWAAPKLIFRVKGVTGAGRDGVSSSSMAFSSAESELVDRLARRRKAEVLVGDAPERPTVVTESRRRWSLAAANDVGKGWVVVELLRNRLVKALEVIDPRRCRCVSFVLVVVVMGSPVSEDMVKRRGSDELEDCLDLILLCQLGQHGDRRMHARVARDRAEIEVV